MKHLGNVSDFKPLRDAELMRAFRRELIKAHYIYLPDIYTNIVEQPASRFWVSEERAAIVVAQLAKGYTLPSMRYQRREMMMEIYRRYKEMRKQHPRTPLNRLVAIIVNQPAPKHYLAPNSAREIIARYKRKGAKDERKG